MLTLGTTIPIGSIGVNFDKHLLRLTWDPNRVC